MTENGEGGAVPTPIQDLDIRELFSYKLSLSFSLALWQLLPCTEQLRRRTAGYVPTIQHITMALLNVMQKGGASLALNYSAAVAVRHRNVTDALVSLRIDE